MRLAFRKAPVFKIIPLINSKRSMISVFPLCHLQTYKNPKIFTCRAFSLLRLNQAYLTSLEFKIDTTLNSSRCADCRPAYFWLNVYSRRSPDFIAFASVYLCVGFSLPRFLLPPQLCILSHCLAILLRTAMYTKTLRHKLPSSEHDSFLSKTPFL